MSEQKIVFRSWGSEVLRHWRARNVAAAKQSQGLPHEPYHLERIATCACGGYFHMGCVMNPLAFTAELSFEGQT
jgi:hypothetical protein